MPLESVKIPPQLAIDKKFKWVNCVYHSLLLIINNLRLDGFNVLHNGPVKPSGHKLEIIILTIKYKNIIGKKVENFIHTKYYMI